MSAQPAVTTYRLISDKLYKHLQHLKTASEESSEAKLNGSATGQTGSSVQLANDKSQHSDRNPSENYTNLNGSKRHIL